MKKIDFIYFDAGGGHRAAATALKTVMEADKRPWEVRLVHVQELLDPVDVFRKVTGLRLEDVYNKMLEKGWTLGSALGLKFMHAVIRRYHRPSVRLFEDHFRQSKPDLVVSVVPNFNRALYESLRATLPGVPYVTVLTDFADYPPHFWMEPKQEQYFVCGTEKAVAQARAMGYGRERIFRTSGMIIRPMFYEPVNVDRAKERVRLGLDPEKLTGLVLFGAQGSKVMIDMAKRLQDTQLIFICGRNQKLAEALRALPSKAARFVEGFTTGIPYYMHLADFLVGKPGPGSISEAVAMKLPVIVECNAWTVPQERYNAEWVREQGVGVVLSNFRAIRQAVSELGPNLASFRSNVAKIENRAILEIPTILQKILDQNSLERQAANCG